mmetsp:Transcript_4063/g.7062  ORF Transcript_4063/g.7062 Transcript_4063/m.7062 type:complete len:499 (+) Transcript_4063:15-1511(+)
MMKVALFLLGATGASAFSSVRRCTSSSSTDSRSQLQAATKSLEAILFDCDGVLADTERDGHRISFNIAFGENGIDESWDELRYGKLLEVGGGKERMTAHWNEVGWPNEIPEEGRSDKIMSLHLQKTDIFMKLIDEGKIPLRPGVLRIVDEAIAAGVRLAVCSTSNEKAVSNLVSTLMGAERASKFQIYAGDMVKKKKPAPDVYLMAVDQMGLDKERCVIIEDSHIGVGAAVAAGISCLVTKSSYTWDEDFTGAKMIVEELGDSGDVVTLETLTSLLSGNEDDTEWDPVGHVEKGGASWTGARLGDDNLNKPRTYTPSETYVPSNPKSIGVEMENHVEKGGASWTGARFGDSEPTKSKSLSSIATGERGIGVKMESHVEKGGASWTGARFGDSEPKRSNPLRNIATGPKSIGVQMESHIEKGGASWSGARFGDESVNAAEYTPSETYEFKSQGKFTGAEWDGASHKDVSVAQDDTAWSGARLGDKDVKRVGPTPSNWHE